MELWKTDGTESGTVMVKDITPGTDPWGGPGNFIVFDNALHFVANGGSGSELWKSDGTASGTALVKDIYPGNDNFGDVASSNPANLTEFNGALYFSATDGNGTELWKSDGTELGTLKVKDILLLMDLEEWAREVRRNLQSSMVLFTFCHG